MNSKFPKSGILKAVVHSYCLVCEEYLANEFEFLNHILNSKHNRVMSTSDYLRKFTDDRIRKVETGYYCELCNVCLETKMQIDVHVIDTGHIQKKGLQYLRRSMENKDMIIYKDVAIAKDAWNGIINDFCVICESPCEPKEWHITSEEHLLQLVLVEVQFGLHNSIYRVLRNKFHCLTCNEVYRLPENATEFIENHFETRVHQDYYKKSKINQEADSDDEYYSDSSINALVAKVGKKDNNDTEAGPSAGSAQQLLDEASNGPPDLGELKIGPTDFNVNRVNVHIPPQDFSSKMNIATPTISPSVNDPIIPPTVSNPPKRNVVSNLSLDPRALHRLLSSFVAKKRNIYDWPVELDRSVLQIAYDDFNTVEYKVKSTPRSSFPCASNSVQKMNIRDFIDHYYIIDRRNEDAKDVVINNEIAIEYFSYFGLKYMVGSWWCLVCKKVVSDKEIDNHRSHFRHKFAMKRFNIVIFDTIENTFVREIRDNVYHCGHCNIIQDSINEMLLHLKTNEHEDEKRASEWKLQIYKLKLL